MRRLGVDEPPPGWLRDCPTAQSARPHWVLRDAALAPVVEVGRDRSLDPTSLAPATLAPALTLTRTPQA